MAVIFTCKMWNTVCATITKLLSRSHHGNQFQWHGFIRIDMELVSAGGISVTLIIFNGRFQQIIRKIPIVKYHLNNAKIMTSKSYKLGMEEGGINFFAVRK